MYEPIRTKSVHSVASTTTPAPPRRSRDEELDFQLAGHLSALLTVTDELRALAPSDDLGRAVEQLAECVARLRHGVTPARMPATPSVTAADPARVAALHRRAQALAGRALVVAASRQDTASAVLAARRLDAHEAAVAA